MVGSSEVNTLWNCSIWGLGRHHHSPLRAARKDKDMGGSLDPVLHLSGAQGHCTYTCLHSYRHATHTCTHMFTLSHNVHNMLKHTHNIATPYTIFYIPKPSYIQHIKHIYT